jgi:hypothetical protein
MQQDAEILCIIIDSVNLKCHRDKIFGYRVSGSKVEEAARCYGPDHAREYALLTVTSNMAVINCYSYYM